MYDNTANFIRNAWRDKQAEDTLDFPRSRIYFIDGDGGIKIGFSIDPMGRMKSLQSGNPRELKMLGTMRGHQRTELALHDLFRTSRIRPKHEWFNDAPAIRSFITRHCRPDKKRLKITLPQPQGVVANDNDETSERVA